MTEEGTTNEEHNNDDSNNDGQNNLIKGDEKDLQRITSWIGRVEANTKKQTEQLAALAEKLDSVGPKSPDFGDSDQAKLNEKLHEMILEGKVMDALSIVTKIQEEAKARVKRADEQQFSAAIEAISDDPLMKNDELSQQVRDTAAQMMKKGHDAQTAVDIAKTKVENQVLRSSTDSGASLEMLAGGGKQPPATKEKKLPPAAERAFQQGLDKGYFKDRQDYIDTLDPRVRAEWGLDA